jgi:hypothetical protein
MAFSGDPCIGGPNPDRTYQGSKHRGDRPAKAADPRKIEDPERQESAAGVAKTTGPRVPSKQGRVAKTTGPRVPRKQGRERIKIGAQLQGSSPISAAGDLPDPSRPAARLS